MSKAKFNAVRELIREERYDEARAILLTMRGNATADKWLERLNELAPPPPADPTVVTREELNYQIESALEKQNAQQRRRGRRGCMIRGCFYLFFLTCTCVWIVPALIFAANLLNLPQGEWVRNSYASFTDTQLGQQIDNQVDDFLMNAATQLEPRIQEACRTAPNADPQVRDLCVKYSDDLTECLLESMGNISGCVKKIGPLICERETGGDPQARAYCLDAVNSFEFGIGP